MAQSIHEPRGRPELGSAIDLHPPASVDSAAAAHPLPSGTAASVTAGEALAEITAIVKRRMDAIKATLESGRHSEKG